MTSPVADARIFISLASTFTTADSINSLADTELERLGLFISNTGSSGPHLQFSTSGSVLALLLCHVPAVGVTLDRLAYIVSKISLPSGQIERPEELEDELFASLIEKNIIFDSDNEPLVLQTASDIAADTRLMALVYGFDPLASTGLVLSFVKAKLRKLSAYIHDFERFSAFFDLLAYDSEFKSWQNGFLMPYIHYSQKTPLASTLPYEEYVNLLFEHQFSYLAQPLAREDTVEWLVLSLLPFIKFHNNNFEPLRSYLFESPERQLANSYKLWEEAVSTIVAQQDQQAPGYRLEKWYLGSCYYYFLYGKQALPSFKVMDVYDSIRRCCSIVIQLQQSLPESSTELGFVFDSTYEGDIATFVSNFEISEASVRKLLEIIGVCERLYPSTRISVWEYFDLKLASKTSEQRQKEAMKIMNGVNESNWENILESLKVFSGAFIEKHEESELSQIIINKFLLDNLFEVVDQIFQTNRLQLDVEVYCQLLLSKFWDLFTNASSLNDKIGKFKLATNIIPLFNRILSNSELSTLKKDEIVRIKHLLKAISNMKNFKLVVEKGIPVTPNQISSKFTSGDSKSPIDLISLVLEQNTKSYLAYEKLYKILNDLILATPVLTSEKSEENQIARLKSACIESALIDNNFSFAYSKSIELFDHCSSEEILSSTWLTFFQVGKYISPKWYDEEPANGDNEKIDVMLKQREILSMLLKVGRKGATVDNSKLIILQLGKLNKEINQWYSFENAKNGGSASGVTYRRSINDNIKRHNAALGSIASEIVSDATNTTHQASEKLSNLFVSGLGWAIGANQ